MDNPRERKVESRPFVQHHDRVVKGFLARVREEAGIVSLKESQSSQVKAQLKKEHLDKLSTR